MQRPRAAPGSPGSYQLTPFGVSECLDCDFDVLAFDSDCMAGHVSRCWRSQHGSACDVEDGAVPWAGHFRADEHPLRERSAAMRAGVVNRIECSVDVENRYFLPAGFFCLGLTRSDLSGSGNLDEISHSAPPDDYH